MPLGSLYENFQADLQNTSHQLSQLETVMLDAEDAVDDGRLAPVELELLRDLFRAKLDKRLVQIELPQIEGQSQVA